MKIYEPKTVEGFEWVLPVDSADWETFVLLGGSSRVDSWSPIRVYLLHHDEGMRLESTPMPWMGATVLVLKREAVDAIGDYLSRWGELLPLECEEGELFVFNALHSLSALDEENADIARFDSGNIMAIDRHAFHESVIADVEIFKVKEDPRGGAIYLTGDAVETICRHDLAGVDFKLVWSSD